MDLEKREMTLMYGGCTFTLRAYRDGSGLALPGWHAVVSENRTPLHHGQPPNASAAGCFAEAVRFLTAAVEGQPRAAPAGVAPDNHAVAAGPTSGASGGALGPPSDAAEPHLLARTASAGAQRG